MNWSGPSCDGHNRPRHVRFAGIDISYRSELDGGGTEFGQQFIPFLKSRGMPKQKRAFEWCCGPGFIGFSMLGNGLCETLCLSDINSAAVSSCQHTVRVNELSDRVSVYQSDNLKSIPRSEMWNLIVSNPPHFIDQYEGDIRAHDPDWQIHRNFFATVSGSFGRRRCNRLAREQSRISRRDLSAHDSAIHYQDGGAAR